MDFFDLYIKYEYAVAATQLTLAMLGMGATLTPGDFKEVVRDARAFSIGFVLQMRRGTAGWSWRRRRCGRNIDLCSVEQRRDTQ